MYGTASLGFALVVLGLELGAAALGCGEGSRAGPFARAVELSVEGTTATRLTGVTEAATEAIGDGGSASRSCEEAEAEGDEAAFLSDDQRPAQTIAAHATLAATPSATRRDRGHRTDGDADVGDSVSSTPSTVLATGAGRLGRFEWTGDQSVKALEPEDGTATPRADASSASCSATVGHRFA